MRSYRGTGPFKERPFYSDREIEEFCSEALSRCGLLPSVPGPIRIERLIEKLFGVPVIYELLPHGVLGFTEFGLKGVVGVHVADGGVAARSQAEERRVNATLAHEAGHGLMHAHLFALELDHQAIFEDDPDVGTSRVLCRDGATGRGDRGGRGYDGRWWELQANRAIGAFLMPQPLLLQALEPLLSPSGQLGGRSLRDDRREEAVQLASETFDVNPAVARIRLDSVLPSGERQLTL